MQIFTLISNQYGNSQHVGNCDVTKLFKVEHKYMILCPNQLGHKNVNFHSSV